MATCTFREARSIVLDRVLSGRRLERECVPLEQVHGRVLAGIIAADRDYPPCARSIRDGFAVRAADLPGAVEVIGEVRAGGSFSGTVEAGQCVEIMTGAPLPAGADAVVMVEHARREGYRVFTDREPMPGEFVNPQGAESRKGQPLLGGGTLVDFAQLALLAQTGHTSISVYRKPRVAILSTGDEVIPVTEAPTETQVRNSNAWSLAAQVARAGGLPEILPVAADNPEETRRLILEGLERDLLLLSGGVSAGKYDYVEPVMAELEAEFYFDRVLIQPGQPLVFGRARDRFFFGLPGNPASTMVTFELFARGAVELLGGREAPELRMPVMRLTEPFRHKTGLTRFLPARMSEGGTAVTPVKWQGSSDVAALARANAFLVAEAQRESWEAGEMIGVLLP
ncbi:MAG: molybdopterin molybdotransferase MoeA [Bryobacteraceae bacterium]